MADETNLRELDNLSRVLNHHVRRETIHYFERLAESVSSLDQIADFIANNRAESRDKETRDRLRIELHHLHLPKLADADLIEYDPKSGLVRYIPDDDMEELLQTYGRL